MRICQRYLNVIILLSAQSGVHSAGGQAFLLVEIQYILTILVSYPDMVARTLSVICLRTGFQC